MEIKFKKMTASSQDRLYDTSSSPRLFSCEFDLGIYNSAHFTDIVVTPNDMPSWNIKGGSILIHEVGSKSNEYKLCSIKVFEEKKNKLLALLEFTKDVEIKSQNKESNESDIVRSSVIINAIPLDDEVITLFKLEHKYDIKLAFND